MSTNPGGPRPFPGSITIEHEAGGRRVLRLSGDVDSVTVAEFESRQGGLPVVVDVIDAGAVSFLSSAGLAVMVRNVQSGFLRSYALLLVTGFAALALYFLLSSS